MHPLRHFFQPATVLAALIATVPAAQATSPAKNNNAAAPEGASPGPQDPSLITQSRPLALPQRRHMELRSASVPLLAAAPPVALQERKGNPGGARALHLSRQWKLTATTQGTQNTSSTSPAPEALGWARLPFTSARVEPQLDTSYPTRTVGRLVFSDGTYYYHCTGSVIAPGIVLTAGHCVHQGSGDSDGFYTGFTFTPGLRDNQRQGILYAPYGIWSNWRRVYVSSGWYSGGGNPVNTQDWALIVFGRVNGLNIGDHTGWLGWRVGKAFLQQLTVLGYPSNLGWGGQLNRVDTLGVDLAELTGEQVNNLAWGSDMTHGSSGGPVVKNWGLPYPNLTGPRPRDSARNQVVSVVSWGSEGMPNMVAGSLLDQDFVGMFNQACTDFPKAC